MTIQAIETRYAGCRFRSRLEARWAVFFDTLGIKWEYEPQGFLIDGKPYLPDFLLPECGTWIEVKGAEAQLDRDRMFAAAQHLPQAGLIDPGPALMILGPIPEPTITGDWHWVGLDITYSLLTEGVRSPRVGYYGFGFAHYRFTVGATPQPRCVTYVPPADPEAWLTPTLHPYPADMLEGTLAHLPDPEYRAPDGVQAAYAAARSARFEHGETP